ncbi:unnamed protein product [Musa acuminata subsp. malaccensis]|uniref:(wild Malaysian banana) hypothetical protein n=1 Tax=Musa acuminata subsp. malaccensis TaxID=214687 RepID=A0A804K1L1_MUSAM|nr:unnamed protein product [Musa acuminata subsp. malaccensis]
MEIHKFSTAGRILLHNSVNLLSAIWNKWFVVHLMYIIWI